MNDETPLSRRSPGTVSTIAIGQASLAIVAALEAIEVGDIDFAVAILQGALEDGPRERPHRCECGASFEWPGLREAHRFSHEHLGDDDFDRELRCAA